MTGVRPSSFESAASLASASRTYFPPGGYTLTLRVTDEEGSGAEAQFKYIVVLDSASGFVTGGGWIQSSASAYAADPALSGKANFGFVSKYQKARQSRRAKPSSNCTSRRSTSRARRISGYKGSGTINGSGDYGFLLTGTDGQVNGGGGVDKFRIKIWNRSTGATVYDNVPAASDDLDTANPQAIGGGSISIKAR